MQYQYRSQQTKRLREIVKRLGAGSLGLRAWAEFWLSGPPKTGLLGVAPKQ
jgi:hypothetical protein